MQEGRKWEECRGIGGSFGYNRNEDADDYMTARALVHLLADTVSKGGNLFLNVGPTADGRIPAIMQDRLLAIGRWLEVNGEAIYGTRPWKIPSRESPVRFTSKGHTLYAICLSWPGPDISLPVFRPVAVSMLGLPAPLQWHYADDRLHVALPAVSPDAAPCDHAYVLRIESADPA